ncbi:PREDICTED: uncharacterized protein LOC109213926 [Nicotiana attenuata]|uniref:Uncharacterized protein n=1 Tax=Nicotiana attenuata TaxID=49451 RepID=A0A1J6IPY7_NICAT|nr:PREDICTED: uncharacterized protein LOC109213926 [Nicotiana attenuata]OIT06770.1 hypothetical protein A4A49_37098 [Nicotiana attenuata]
MKEDIVCSFFLIAAALFLYHVSGRANCTSHILALSSFASALFWKHVTDSRYCFSDQLVYLLGEKRLNLLNNATKLVSHSYQTDIVLSKVALTTVVLICSREHSATLAAYLMQNPCDGGSNNLHFNPHFLFVEFPWEGRKKIKDI